MPDWNETEKNISEVEALLKKELVLSPFRQNDPIDCKDCLFRNISIFIVSGKVTLNRLEGEKIWGDSLTTINEENKPHGSTWHNNYLIGIKNYFEKHGYDAKQEPNLYFGKADIEIQKLKLYVEIGTIGLYKLYVNLLNMKDCRIIVCPSKDLTLEFIL